MDNHKTTDQPGSNDNQNNSQASRNHDAHDTGGNRPNMEQVLSTENKSKQEVEANHDVEKTKEERGGHGHSGHSGNRNGSRK